MFTSFCLRKKVKVGLLFLAIFIIIAITIDDGITKKNAPNCRSKRQFIFNLLRNIKLYNFSFLAKKPLCIDGILQRERRPPGVNSPPVLLTDGEDPNQVNRDCRLHHYTQVDVTACIDELSYRRAKHKEPVHIAFLGESVIRPQFLSFLRVHFCITCLQSVKQCQSCTNYCRADYIVNLLLCSGFLITICVWNDRQYPGLNFTGMKTGTWPVKN